MTSLKNVKTSHAVYEIEETVVEVAENLQKIRQHQQKNLSTLKEKRNEIEKDIRKTRATINNHLDKLQEDLLKQLYAVEERENLNIRHLLSALDTKDKEISDKKKNITNTKQHATELQLFLSIKKIEEDISSKDDILNSLLQDGNLKNHFLEYEVNTAIQKIITDIKRFGDIHIQAKPSEIVLSRRKTKQAQTMIPIVQSRSIEDIKLKINKTIRTKGNYIFGCCMLPDGRMVFTYYTESIVRVFSNEGFKDFEVKMTYNIYDIVYNSEDNTLAVTSGGSKEPCITIIDLKRNQITKTISLDSFNFGIALRENKLIFSSHNKGIRIINIHDESVSDIVRVKMPSDCKIATFENQLYHTNCDTSVVTCYDLHGKLQWTFHNKRVLEEPRGVDVDSDGNVYAVGFKTHNVVVISPDNKRHREVLSAGDGLKYPVSLCYSESKNQLLVANWEKQARLFDFY